MAAPADDGEEYTSDDGMRVMITEGMKGGGVAAAAVTAFHLLASKWEPYRKFGVGPKYFWLSSVAVAAFWISAETAHMERMAAQRERIIARREALDREFRARQQ